MNTLLRGAVMVAGETILVTGSTGFIGLRLLRYLACEGVKVRIFLRPESQSGAIPGGLEVVRGSFTDHEALGYAVRGVDRIIHLAGVTKAVDEAAYDAGNVLPVQNLLAAVARHNPALKRFLYVSSLAAAGPASEGIRGVTEFELPHPVSAYGRSKLRAETVCFNDATKIPVTIVRPPTVYGPGDRDVFQVFLMLSKGILVSPAGSAQQRFSMIYVDDLVAGMILAATSDQAVGRIYYVSSSPSYSWDDVIAAAKPVIGFRKLYKVVVPQSLLFVAGRVIGDICSFWGKPSLINRDKVTELVQHYWVCSADRAEGELGFKAVTTLADGVAATIAWYRRTGWL